MKGKTSKRDPWENSGAELKPSVDTWGLPDMHLQQLSIASAIWDIVLWHNLNLINLENTINTP